MEWFDIKHDKEALKKDYLDYFNFTIKTQLKHDKKPLVFMFTCLLISIFSFILFKIDNGNTNLVSFFAGLLGFLYYPASVFIKKILILKWFNKNSSIYQKEYKFAFNENGIYFQAADFNSEVKWEYFSCYEINQQKKTIYIYGESNKIEVLLLERLLGEKGFEKIHQTIIRKLPYKKH